MSPLEQARRWWQAYTGEEETPIDGDTPAWLVSLLLHVVVLLGLALAGLAGPPRSNPAITIIQPTELIEEEVLLVPESIAVSTEVPEAVGAESQQSADVAEALAPTLSEVSVVPVVPDQELVSDISIEPVDAVPTGPQIDATVVVKGAVGVGTTGASGAVDRLTAEIASSLEQRATLVCWLFDQSISLSAQRKEIAARLERVFDELGANRTELNRPDLTNVVVAFGKDATVVTRKPTDDASVVVKAIESISVDDSGAEMTFGAIRRAAEAVKVFRTSSPRKNVMIIVFTDEVGNDQKEADQTGHVCRTLGIPVYVVGVPAPFGMREVRLKYVEPDPQYDQEVQWARIEQGPESFYPEVVRVRSGRFADEAIDSGFGPFSLSKLCGETGGIYFCVHANRNVRGRVSDAQTAAMSSQLRYFFDPQVMRPYQPDYVSAAKIDQTLMANRAKRSLVEAARSSEISPMESPEMTFPRQDDGQLALLLGEAQKVAAKIQPKIDALHAMLAAGAVDRDKIQEKRWQAGFDLSMGRVLAVKVRTDAYNLMLAQAKTGMKFKSKDSDTWQLEPSDELTVGSQTEKLAKQATMYLERVVREHPGTPWALLAGEELRQPLGYRWTEMYTGVNKPNVDAGGGNAGALPDDKRRMVAPPKPKRDLKNL